MDMLNKFLSRATCFKFYLMLIISLLMINCKEDLNESKNNYNIDFSIKFKKRINSFMINNDGTAVVLIKEIDKSDKYYKILFSNEEMNYIQKTLMNSDFSRCDTIKEYISDSPQYIFYINRQNEKKQIISGICKELKTLDKLASFIVATYEKKQKIESFKSLKLMIPPSPPAVMYQN